MPPKPRRLDRIRLRNVRCFRDAEVPLDPRVTVVIGGNGSGKTTLIEALASLTYGDEEGLSAFPLRKGAGHGEIALYETGAKRPVAKWTEGARRTSHQRLPEQRFVFAYGRYRRVLSPEMQSETTTSADPAVILDELANRAGESRTMTLNRPDNKLLQDLSRYLVALNFGRKSDRRLENIWRRLNGCLPKMEGGLEGIRMETKRYDERPMVVRRGMALELSELSDGYQALLVLVFDLMLRYAYLFIGMANPLEGEAVVGIDEVDLHLHPRWQRTVVAQLAELFPNTQFVLTTHSPIVVQGAVDHGRTVITLQERQRAAVPRRLGATLMKKLQGAEVGSLLLENQLFGVESRYSTNYSATEKRTEELQARISRGVATDQDRQELSKDLSKLEELVAAEDERRADGSTVAQMARLQSAFVKDLLRELERAKS